jgi:hypothetical protein
MKRFNSISLELNEEIFDALEVLNIECERAEPCTETKIGTIWTAKFPTELLKLNPVFIDRFVCYFDDGIQEVTIKNNQYKDCDLEDFYLSRTGKYDPVIEDEL